MGVMNSTVVLYLGAVLLGLSVAAPIGPINVEIIRRGLTESSRSAFLIGLGAVSADCFYFSLALAGAGAVTAATESRAVTALGLALGGTMLAGLGLRTIRGMRSIQSPPAGLAVSASSGGEGQAGLRTYLLGLALTLANPMTIALWLSVAAGFAAAAGTAGQAPVLRLAGVFSGALGWVCFVTAATAWARRWIRPELMRGVNLVSGLILVGYGLWFWSKIFLR
jgi:putative LysE/RhtB family amino acid efflux pump